MGNVLLDDYKKDDPLVSFQKWLQQNPELTGKQVHSQNKLFLTSRFSYNSKQILLKVYFKRDNSPVTQVLKSFEMISTLINQQKCANLLPLTILNSKEVSERKQANLIIATRQYLFNTLEDKLQRRPSLTLEQKKWMIFQMIMAVQVVHNHLKIYHGNVRTSNFLVTSYDYLMLTDFANYKPSYILEDTQQGLAEFRLFYSSSLEKCTISPEKLQGKSQSAKLINKPQYLFNLYKENQGDRRDTAKSSLTIGQQKESQQVKQPISTNTAYFEHMNNMKQMDLFSLGICILEVFNDGKSLFTYENLLNLKKGKFNLQELIENIINSQENQQKSESSSSSQLKYIRDVVTQLLLKKNDKPQSLIERFPKIMKNEIYVLLWHCLSCFSKISFQLADHRIYLFQAIIEFIEKQVKWSNYKFVMKKAKCLEKFNALRIFAQIFRKQTTKTPIMFSCEIDPNSILGQILASVQKKDNQNNILQSEDEAQIPQNNKRQSFFINQSKKKRISKKISFAGHFKQSKTKKFLCPPQADQYLEKLVSESNFDMKFSKQNLQERKKTKLQMYLQKIKSQQHIRQQIKSEKSYFYGDFQLIAKIIFSCIRNCQYVASKMLGIQLLNILSSESSDKTLLRVILPYLMDLSQDKDINVAKYAFNSLLDLCYNFIDPFQTEQDIAYYHMLLDFFINTIKGSNIRSVMFTRFEEIYNICEWLEVAYLRIHEKYLEESRFLQSHYRNSVYVQPSKSGTEDNKPFPYQNTETSSRTTINFYKLVDQLKVSYGTFTPRQIQQLMVNIPIAILPQMFQFYISFLNTQKIMGLKCSLFIAENASKQFEMQRYIIDVFDNCMESGLCEMGLALCYSIKYFTIRRNVSIDIVHKIVPHVINPHRWVREEAYKYVRMCLEQFPPAKIFFLFRDVLDAPFPLTVENLQQEVLLPQPLRQMDVNFKDRKFTNRISRKIGISEKKFAEYLKMMKFSKDNNTLKEVLDFWENQTRKLRVIQASTNPALPKLQVNTFISSMRKTIEQLYENNFFFYGFALSLKYNPVQKQQGLNNLFENLKKLSKFNLDSTVVTKQHQEFFENLFTTINSNFQKLLNKMTQQSTPDKLKVSICINLIAQQLCILHQIVVKPTLNFGGGLTTKPQQQDRNFKPKGIQVSQIYQNKQAISGLIKVGEYFFVSGSHDGTLRIYDTRSIQMNIITEAEAVYDLRVDSLQQKQKVKINSLACLQNTYTAVVGTSKGHIKGIQIQRMPTTKNESSRYIKSQNTLQIFKYNIGHDIQKLICPKSPQFSQCIAYITSQSLLGVQDIRTKQLSLKCNIGKQRGYCLSLASNDNFSLLVGTVDGYLLTYDIRFNLVSGVLQLMREGQSLPITNLIRVGRESNKFCVTYPSTNYQFAQFSALDSSETRIQPSRLYFGISTISSTTATTIVQKQDQSIPSIPYFQNRTNDQVFKLCNNNLNKHIYYSQLSNFDTNYKILDYVSQPLTLKESRIRQVWANNCRHRYNQVLSIYNKRCVPFVEYFSMGILTSFNPNPETLGSRDDQLLQTQSSRDLSFLVEKREQSSSSQLNTLDIDRQMITKTNKIKISQFDQTQNKQYLTHCAVLNGFVAVANKNSRIKIYK